jgi:hypothetical protein
VRRHRALSAVVAVLIVAAAAVDVRLFVVPTADRPTTSDAIVVLGGQTYPARLHAALGLIKADPGAVLVVSTPGRTPCPRWATRSTMICFKPDPSTTQGEARETARLAAQHGWTSIEVITTADQVWRARLRFSRCWAGQLRVVQAPTSIYVRLRSVPYETAATVKAELLQRGC